MSERERARVDCSHNYAVHPCPIPLWHASHMHIGQKGRRGNGVCNVCKYVRIGNFVGERKKTHIHTEGRKKVVGVQL